MSSYGVFLAIFSGITDQTLELPTGWSMFSTYMLADDMA